MRCVHWYARATILVIIIALLSGIGCKGASKFPDKKYEDNPLEFAREVVALLNDTEEGLAKLEVEAFEKLLEEGRFLLPGDPTSDIVIHLAGFQAKAGRFLVAMRRRLEQIEPLSGMETVAVVDATLAYLDSLILFYKKTPEDVAREIFRSAGTGVKPSQRRTRALQVAWESFLGKYGFTRTQVGLPGGEPEGIGVSVEMAEERLTIVAISLASPAEAAGLLSGDVILAVNGESIQGMTFTQALSKIRGPKGTTVRLLVQRQRQKPFLVEIVRDVIKIPPTATPFATPAPTLTPIQTAPILRQGGRRGQGDGEFNTPAGVAVDILGNVFVLDAGNRRVQKFDRDGAFVAKWDVSQYFELGGIAVDPRGNVLVTGKSTHGWPIIKFKDAKFLSHLGTFGALEGQFWSPKGIAVDGQGNVYAVDEASRIIVKFNSEGSLAKSWRLRDIGFPENLTLDANANVYVTDIGNHSIQKFTSEGAFLASWGNFPGGLHGIAVDVMGNVYVASGDRIEKFTSEGVLLGMSGIPDNGFARAVAVDAVGNIYIADVRNHRILVFGPRAFE